MEKEQIDLEQEDRSHTKQKHMCPMCPMCPCMQQNPNMMGMNQQQMQQDPNMMGMYQQQMQQWIYVNSVDTFIRTDYEMFLARSSHFCGEI